MTLFEWRITDLGKGEYGYIWIAEAGKDDFGPIVRVYADPQNYNEWIGRCDWLEGNIIGNIIAGMECPEEFNQYQHPPTVYNRILFYWRHRLGAPTIDQKANGYQAPWFPWREARFSRAEATEICGGRTPVFSSFQAKAARPNVQELRSSDAGCNPDAVLSTDELKKIDELFLRHPGWSCAQAGTYLDCGRSSIDTSLRDMGVMDKAEGHPEWTLDEILQSFQAVPSSVVLRGLREFAWEAWANVGHYMSEPTCKARGLFVGGNRETFFSYLGHWGTEIFQLEKNGHFRSC